MLFKYLNGHDLNAHFALVKKKKMLLKSCPLKNKPLQKKPPMEMLLKS